MLGYLGLDDAQLRPHIVWFGEEVSNIHKATKIIEKADIVIIIGTSMEVYPVAGLISNPKKKDSLKFFIDSKPIISEKDFPNLTIIYGIASSGISELLKLLVN